MFNKWLVCDIVVRNSEEHCVSIMHDHAVGRGGKSMFTKKSRKEHVQKITKLGFAI